MGGVEWHVAGEVSNPKDRTHEAERWYGEGRPGGFTEVQQNINKSLVISKFG